MTNIVLFNEQPKYSLFEFEFLQDPMDKNSKLGAGSFASVKLAKEKKTGTLFALKMVRLHGNKQLNSEIYNIKCEIFIHKKLDHPNIIKYHDYIQQDSNIYLILDYAQNGNLYSYIHQKRHLSENEIFRFFYQSCLAIQYLHQNDVFHRDIKPENLLLDENHNIKLCDFGWATQRLQDKRTTFCGTFEYMAPEIVYKRPYDYRVDIWSLGVLLYELIHRESPYKGRSHPEICRSLSRGTIRFSSKCDPEAQDLIQKLLKHNPNERLSLIQILSHTWVINQLSKEENSIYCPYLSQPKTLSHSHSLPPQNVTEPVERLSKEDFDSQTTTNAQSKAQNYDSWSEYFVTNANINPKHRHMKSQHDGVNKSQYIYTDASPKRVLQSSRSNLNLHLDTKQNDSRIYMGETSRIKSPCSTSSSNNNILGNQTPLNNTNTPKKSSEDKKSIFKTNIFSPSFKSKLTSLISQLTVHTPTNQPAHKLEKDVPYTPQNTSLNYNIQSASTYYQASSFCLEDKDFSSKKNSVGYKNDDRPRIPLNKENCSMNTSQTNMQGKSPKVLDHMKNTFKEKLFHPRGDELPVENVSNSTTRTNTSDLSYGVEVKSPIEKNNREAVNKGRFIFKTEKETVVAFTKNHDKQDNSKGKMKERSQIVSKKTMELRNILGTNTVKYQIPIPTSTSCRQGRNKENFPWN